jgi:hypothetical protein
VLDVSSSMGNGPGSSCAAMVSAAGNFVTLFSPFDQIGLVTFDYTAHLLDPPTDPIATVESNIAGITCGNNTNTISALEVAYQQIKSVGKPLALNTIVLFTDGSPNGVTANFPVRTQIDSRWGPDENNDAQTGSTFNIANSCADGAGNLDAPSQAQTNAICLNMPAYCVVAGATLTGTLVQHGNQDSFGGDTWGLVEPVDGAGTQGSCPNMGQDDSIRQFIAYIPDSDIYGNDLHGVPNTGPGPTVANVVNDSNCPSCSFVTRDYWLFQLPLANQTCSPDSSVQPNCKSEGAIWQSTPTYASIGTGSNFFPVNSTQYANANVYPNKFRPDQPNTVVVASMNGTMAEAAKIRSDTTYHPVIHTIYLTGNSYDAVDREFLPIVANAAWITPLPYDSQYNSDPTVPPAQLYANPPYHTTQETGKYLVTSDKNSLTVLFAQLASEVLRLSH